jgi:hypothetical protein
MMVAGAGWLQLQWAEVVDMGRFTTDLFVNTTMGPACSVVAVGTNQVVRAPSHITPLLDTSTTPCQLCHRVLSGMHSFAASCCMSSNK